MRAFTAPMGELAEFHEIERKMAGNRGILQITGCIDSQKPHLIYALGQSWQYRIVIAGSEIRARELYEALRLYDRDAMYFPAKDLIFFQADIHGNLLEQQRASVMKALSERRELTVVTTAAACMNHLMPFESWQDHIQVIDNDSPLDMEEMKKQLLLLGYERTPQVEGPGQFAIRGGILDIYPLTEANPIRIELWGDEVDSIRYFDVENQRSIENLEAVYLYPAAELILSEAERRAALRRIEKEAQKAEAYFRKHDQIEEAVRVKRLLEDCGDSLTEMGEPLRMEGFIDYFYEKPVSFLDYFPAEKTALFLDDPNRMKESADAVEMEFRESMRHRLEKGYALPGQTGLLFSAAEMAAAMSSRHAAGLCTMENIRAPWIVSERFSLNVRSVNSYNNSFELLLHDLERWKKERCRVVLLSVSRTRGRRLAQELMDQGLTAYYTEDEEREAGPGEILITCGSLSKGFEYPLIRFVVIAESDIFGKEKKKRAKYRRYEGKKIQDYTELSVGDYVVHENHGIGIYRGIEKMDVDHVTKDYFKIEYAGGSNLYVSTTQLDAIQKYADGDASVPRLNKLGTQEWSRTKTRVRGAVRDIAQDLVRLYAARQRSKGFVYGQDTVWQKEFEEMFPFEETDDQLRAIEAVKQDMESDRIMDRLVCGDVGFGKTEIAIRAAFKAVQEGKQVAFLAPTTILAQQHYNTFVQRMRDFPVRVDLMCRFRSQAEQKKTAVDTKKGLVDIVVGTHRLLSKDMEFKDLGLLVIDEEQRFGVTHKEKLKQMKNNVDVLTLTATPIPRTLHMSLIGVRDMSVLEEAPQERQPIQTYVMEYNEEMVREAIGRELARGGQVYYVYNRVNTIADMTDTIAKLAPEAQVAFAHGQMQERDLERIMLDFINGDIDVLVTTTIIETGLDISNVNTMIIHDADNMGLSQLYQLRGRVGRSNRTAYAFLMYRRDKVLREVAEKRLSAIREFTELGSGVKIAMRDLEIRGAGNLLGSEQHGHMEAVGYDLYCKLLSEAVREAQGQTTEQEQYETSIDVDIDAYIPDSYIRSESQKMDIYKRIAAISGQEDYEDMLEELMDRFGEPPKAVQNLLAVARLKARAHSIYITDLSQREDEIRMVMYKKARIDASGIDGLLKYYRGRLRFAARSGEAPYFTYRSGLKAGKERENPLGLIEELLAALETLKKQES